MSPKNGRRDPPERRGDPAGSGSAPGSRLAHLAHRPRPPVLRATAGPPGLVPGSPLVAAHPADLGVDERVDVALQNAGRVPRLHSGAGVLDALVRVQHVVADLGAPAAGALAAQVVQLGPLLLALALQQLGLEHADRKSVV